MTASLAARRARSLREALNNAWREYGRREPYRREEIAHCVAWAAVKKRYHKVGNDWIPHHR
jgi:cation transport regulator